MSQGAIKLKMVGKQDSTRDKNDYYFTVPKMPCLVDLSKVVIFVHPFDNEDGTFGAEMVIKEHNKRKKGGKRDAA